MYAADCHAPLLCLSADAERNRDPSQELYAGTSMAKRSDRPYRYSYNKGVKIVVLLLCGLALSSARQSEQQGPERDGNFDIRVEPTAKLETAVQVPFQIELADHSHVHVFAAPALTPGVYISKPVFPVAGEWSVYVEVRRDNQMTARTFEFSVAESTP